MTEVIASTQEYLPIKEIRESCLIMQDGSLRSVLMVSSLNFALKSEEEKDAIIASFQQFLNSLNFPIQITTNSRKLDLTNYLLSVRNASSNLRNPLIKLQAEEYIAFIENLLETANIMEKRFFVVIPFYPMGIETPDGISKIIKKKPQTAYGHFEESRKNLLTRTEEIISSLTSLGLRCAALNTEELIELYYTLYNPETAQNQKVSAAAENVSVTEGKNV